MSQRAWLLLYRPTDLTLAIVVADHLGRLGFVVGLVYGEHDYWKYVRLDPYADRFHTVHRISNLMRVDGLRQIWGFCSKVKAEVAALNSLGIDPRDLVVSFSATAYLCLNVFISFCRANPKLLLISRDSYWSTGRTGYPAGNRSPTWTTLLEVLCSLRMTMLVAGKSEAGKFGEWRLLFREPLHHLFDVILLTSFDSSYALDVEAKMPLNTFVTENPLGGRQAPHSGRQKVVYFSGGMGLFVKEKFRTTMVRAINAFLTYLRKHFGHGYDLIYRPHPFYEGEIAMLDLAGFSVEMDGEISEIYLQRHQDDIHAVFSDISSSSMAASASGIRSGSFAKLLPIPACEIEAFCAQFPDVPDSHYLGSLEEKPLFDMGASGMREDHEARRIRFGRDFALSVSTALGKDRSIGSSIPMNIDYANSGPLAMINVGKNWEEREQILTLEQTIKNLRHEIDRLQEHLIAARVKDLQLMQKERIIQELKVVADQVIAKDEELQRKELVITELKLAADERLAVIHDLIGRNGRES